ncbi:hydroxyacid dehydrogenase [Effusibacillus dendaii]|uniref:Phosphoglycerate dehydrogenase n=1 Tax=Effusibacillus dendaii TaxID=2743772 RepID=A0A7I8D8B1_9BACL|nr:hydroxyacid dehydrogenase [Effusibacillus dendaii]BCJ85602.1 hypothetical protein skT53_05870 [Effusibacillus dendaii]
MPIVITEDVWWPIPDWITSKYEVLQDFTLWSNPEHIVSVGANADALVVRNRTKVDRLLLESLPRLRVVGRLGVGLDNIDLQACRDLGIVVVAAKGCNANAVAEYVIACMFQHARFLSVCDSCTRTGVWDRQKCMGRELNGKTLGLIGVGDIGQRVAVRARALGLRVIAYDPFLLKSHMLVQDFAVELTRLQLVCQMSDYISVHVPLTATTRHLITENELALCKKDAVLINTSRGGIINENALFTHLTKQPESFAFLDVREKEPSAADDPFLLLPNLFLTPHIAGITHESSQRVAELVLDDIDRVLSGQNPMAAVVYPLP